jgi:hypothetical protein
METCETMGGWLLPSVRRKVRMMLHRANEFLI